MLGRGGALVPKALIQPQAARIAAVIRGARCAARMTQAELGAACGYSASGISRVESGELRPNWSVLAKIAEALGLDITVAVGGDHPGGRPARSHPVPAESAPTTVAVTVDQREDAVRRRNLLAGAVGAGTALIVAGPAATAQPTAPTDPLGPLEQSLFTRPEAEPWQSPRIAAVLGAARSDFHAARYDRLGAALPALIAGAEAHRDAVVGLAREQAQASVAHAYVLATELAVKSHADFAWVTADRALSAAHSSGNPVVVGEAARVLAITMRRAGRPQAAVNLLADTARSMDGGTSAEGAVRATLLMTAAYTAAVGAQPRDALDLMGGAEQCVDQLPAVRPTGELFTVEATRTQCDLYRVGVHNALRTPDEGVVYAQRITPARLPTVERRARYGTDTARMWHALGDRKRTLAALLGVERVAAQEVRRPALRALTADLLYGPGALTGLREFALRTGAATA